jgi:glucose-6-phosphate 1-epimerase
MGETLDLSLTTQNTGAESLRLTQALHTYFNVSDVSAVTVSGLDSTEYLDQLSGQKHRQAGNIEFTSEVDRVYFDRGGAVRVVDPGYQREILITKKNSATSVVWNPWIEKSRRLGDMGLEGYRTMVCVESANVQSDEVLLSSGQSHALAVSYHCLSRQLV